MIDFKKYKPSLKQYLSTKGFKPNQNPMFCFSPNHHNTDTPSCLIYDTHFKCESGSCGIHGDIYDACEVLTGITEKSEQYKEVEQTLGGYTPTPVKVKFTPDQTSISRLLDYLRNHVGRQKGVMQFLHDRGYSDSIAEKMLPFFAFWPGYDIALQEIGHDILRGAGVPGIGKEKNFSSWDHSGVIVKLGKGLKLCYYQNGKCEKRGSKSCSTFPMPGKLPEGGKIILVEAEITAIAMRALCFENVYSTGGTNGLTEKAIKESLLNFEEITFAFDGDVPGFISAGFFEYLKQSLETNQITDNSIIKFYDYEPKEKKYILKTDLEFAQLKEIDKLSEKLSFKKNKFYPAILIKNGFKGIIKQAQLPNGKDFDDIIRDLKFEETAKQNISAILNNALIYNPKKESNNIKHVDQKEKVVPFLFLGCDDKSYYVLPKTQNIPIRIGRGDNNLKNWIKEIAPAYWWFDEFQKTNIDGDVSFDIGSAIAWFREKSQEKGIFNDERIMGLGAHLDGKSIVFNCGNHLFIDNKKIEYENYKGKNIYIRSKVEIELAGNPWTISEGVNLIKQIKTFNFERPIDYMVIAGYIALAPFASMLTYRPHIWITAKQGTGKSTLLINIIRPLLGENQIMNLEGIVSEAYIRQTAGRDCRIPTIDEFDTHNAYEKSELQRILRFARSCYGGSESGKGTPDHRPIKFLTKMMFCFASVNVQISDDATRNRIVICNMKQKTDSMLMQAIENPDGLRLRILSRLKDLNENIKKAKALIMQAGHDNRTGDTYSPFLAGFWMIISDKLFLEDNEKVCEFIKKSISNIKEYELGGDEDRLLERIFQERIRIKPDYELTVAEILTMHEENSLGDFVRLTYDDVIRRYGIRRCRTNKNLILAIDLNHPAIKNILKDTPFSEYKEILQRHNFVIDKSRTVYMSGKNTRCVILDWQKLQEKYFTENTNDEIPF